MDNEREGLRVEAAIGAQTPLTDTEVRILLGMFDGADSVSEAELTFSPALGRVLGTYNDKTNIPGTRRRASPAQVRRVISSLTMERPRIRTNPFSKR